MEKSVEETERPCPFLLKLILLACTTTALMLIMFPKTGVSSPETIAEWAGNIIGYAIPVIVIIACLELFRRRRWAWRVIQFSLVIPLLLVTINFKINDLFGGGVIAVLMWGWLLMCAVMPIVMILYLQFSKNVRGYIERR